MTNTSDASEEPMVEAHTSDRLGAIVVSVLIGIRFVAAPLFLAAFANDLRTWALCILLVAVLSDAADGLVGRRLGGASPLLGAFADPLADFALVLAAFTAFVLKDLYPGWLLLLIIVMFAQFVLTSRLAGPIYDPVGKYYGVFLFAAAVPTVLLRSAGARQALLMLILAFTAASLISRALFLLGLSMQRYRDQGSPDSLRELPGSLANHGRVETSAGLLMFGNRQAVDADQRVQGGEGSIQRSLSR